MNKKTANLALMCSSITMTGSMFAGSALAQEPELLQLEEVVVTAQKREESLTEAPLTVNLVSADAMRDAAIFQADELNKLTAGVEVRYEGDSNAGVAIRGVGTFAQQTAPPRVSTYLDDFFIGSQGHFAFASMYDMKQVQILRGPQGTLYGQPSPTGALILETADPNLDEFEGNIRASYQFDPQGYNVQGALSVPLIEGKLAARIALLSDDRETGTENIIRKLDEARNRDGARVKLLFEPTDTLSAKLGYTILKTEDSDTYIVMESINPLNTLTDGTPIQLEAEDRTAIAGSPDEIVDEQSELVTLNLEWALSDAVTINWFSGNYFSDNTRDSDQDSTDYAAASLPATFTKFDQNIQHELRVIVDPADWWSFQIGGYYQDSESRTDAVSFTEVPGQPPFPAAPTGLFEVILDIPSNQEVKAAFMHNDFYIGDETTLTVGIRYNEFTGDNSNIIDSNFYFGSVLANNNTFSDPAFVLESPLSCVADPTQTPPCVNSRVKVDKEWTGTIKLAHTFSEALNMYATIDHGFRPGSPNFDVSGAFQPTDDDPTSGLNFYDGETVDSIEIGAKGSIFDGRGQYTSSVFYSVYEDYQVRPSFEVFNGVDSSVSTISNADVNVDEAVQWGIEAELRYLVTENFELFGSVAYANVELTDGLVPCTDPAQAAVDTTNRFNKCDADGDTGSPQPEWFATFKADYSLPFEPISGEWSVSALLNYRSDIEVTGDSAGRFESDGYTTVDLFTGLRADSWDAQLYIKNVLDEEGILSRRSAVSDAAAFATSLDRTADYNELILVPPRSVGITVGYYF